MDGMLPAGANTGKAAPCRVRLPSAMPPILSPPPPAGGVFFVLGGPLDGDGLHWLDRFYRLYASVGTAYSQPQIRAAFDHAECRAAADRGMKDAAFAAMVERHVAWQFE